MERHKVISIILSLIVAIGFLLFVFRKPGIFHLLPFSIHQSLFRNVIKESTFIDIFEFIDIFDIFFSVGLFFLLLRIFGRMIRS